MFYHRCGVYMCFLIRGYTVQYDWHGAHVVKVPVQGREGGVFVAEETQLVVEETQEDTGYVEGLHYCSRTQSDGEGGERNHIWLTNRSVHNGRYCI